MNKIDFKLGVNKFKSKKFCIKNHSGIQTSYKLILKNYLPFKENFKGSSTMSYEEAFDNHNANMIINELSDTGKFILNLVNRTFLSNNSKTTHHTHNSNKTHSKSKFSNTNYSEITKLLLSDKHEENNFTSEKGMEFSIKKQIEKEAQCYLKNNKGVAIVVDPLKGKLPAYGEVIIKVSVYNECVGDFEDELICEVKGLADKKYVPITVKIRGNPIQISPFQTGIDYESDPPVIDVGSIIINCGYIEKNFKLLNTGNNTINLKWKNYDYEDIIKPKARNLVNFEIHEQITERDGETKRKYKVVPFVVEPKEFKNQYFMIRPLEALIYPKKTVEFKIVFATDQVGVKSSLLLARMEFKEGNINTSKMSDLAIKINGNGVIPHLTVNKNPNLDGIILYKMYEHSSGANFINRKSIILVNKEKIGFKCRIDIDGPFKIMSTFPIGACISEGIYSILPNTNLKLDVKFIAPKPSDEDNWPLLLNTEKMGKITVIYENKIKEEFYLKGILQRPRLLINLLGNEHLVQDKDIIDFSYVNVESYCIKKLFIMNETNVTTDWSINYVFFKRKTVYGYGTTTVEEKEDIDMTDDPEVFNFNVIEGIIHGPSNALKNIPTGPGVYKRDDYKMHMHDPIEIQIKFKVSQNYYI